MPCSLPQGICSDLWGRGYLRNQAGKITQTAQIKKRGKGRYSGTFYNAQYNIAGRIRVTMRGRRQMVILTSSEGSGRLSLRKR